MMDGKLNSKGGDSKWDNFKTLILLVKTAVKVLFGQQMSKISIGKRILAHHCDARIVVQLLEPNSMEEMAVAEEESQDSLIQ